MFSSLSLCRLEFRRSRRFSPFQITARKCTPLIHGLRWKSKIYVDKDTRVICQGITGKHVNTTHSNRREPALKCEATSDSAAGAVPPGAHVYTGNDVSLAIRVCVLLVICMHVYPSNSRVDCQGSYHTEGCADYGTKMVGGVNPKKAGSIWTSANGKHKLPVFKSVQEVTRTSPLYMHT